MSSILDYVRPVLRSGSRLLGSRHKTMELLKTLALVVPLTLLIWVYAERAQTSTEKASVIFDVMSTEPNQYATISEPMLTPVTIELSGPRSRVESVKTELERISADRRLRATLTSTYPSGSEQNIPVVPMLNNLPGVRNAGVTVTSATPSTVKVRIDPLVELEVPVKLPGDLPFSVRNVTIDPTTVRVRGPQTLLEKLFPTPTTGAALDLSIFLPKITGPGPQRLNDVPLQLPRGDTRISAMPARVTSVRFDVVASESEYTIPSMPLSINKPLLIEESLVAVIPREKTVTNVLVRGPVDQIDKLRPRENQPPQVTPLAVLPVRPDDVGRTDVRRRVEITNLPDNVKVVGDAPEIEFSVQKVGGE